MVTVDTVTITVTVLGIASIVGIALTVTTHGTTAGATMASTMVGVTTAGVTTVSIMAGVTMVSTMVGVMVTIITVLQVGEVDTTTAWCRGDDYNIKGLCIQPQHDMGTPATLPREGQMWLQRGDNGYITKGGGQIIHSAAWIRLFDMEGRPLCDAKNKRVCWVQQQQIPRGECSLQ